MTDEELNALVERAMDRAIERLQKLHDYAGRPAWDQVLREELSEPITTLRAQLAEAREKVLREAAAVELQYFDEDGNMSMRKLPFHIKNTILALIEKPNAR